MNKQNFETIEWYLNFAENYYLETADMVYLLYWCSQKNVQRFGFFHHFYSIDEQMII